MDRKFASVLYMHNHFEFVNHNVLVGPVSTS